MKEELNLREKEILRILIQNHLNSVAEISMHENHRVGGYLAELERLEEKLLGRNIIRIK